MNIRDYRLFELDQIAAGELRDADKYIDGDVVDIESLILGKHGLNLESFYDLKKRHDAWAFGVVSSKTIFIDANLMNNERAGKMYRFTLAEELAHYLLHKEIFSTCQTIEDRIKIQRDMGDDLSARTDRQAKALAGALLMPKERIEPRVEELAEDHLRRTGEIDADEICSLLSHEFDVSALAVKYRLRHLGFERRLRMDLSF